MGQVVYFPQRRPAKIFGLYSNEDMIAAEHLIRQGKARRCAIIDLPKSMRNNGLGEIAKGGVIVEGHAINEFEGLCAYFVNPGVHRG